MGSPAVGLAPKKSAICRMAKSDALDIQRPEDSQARQMAHPSAAPEDTFICRWGNCTEQFPTGEELYGHLCKHHVIRRPKHTSGAGAGADGALAPADAPGRKRGAAGGAQLARAAANDEPLRLHCSWDNCNVSVQKRDHMTSHIRIHINMKPFSCRSCDKRFKRTQDLKKHQRTHPDLEGAAEVLVPQHHKSPPLKSPRHQSSPHKPSPPHQPSPPQLSAAHQSPPPSPPVQQGLKRAASPYDHADASVGSSSRRLRQDSLQQQFNEYIDMEPESDPEKLRAVKASLKLLADVHMSQVKPEFNESLAERLDNISLVLNDSSVLERLTDAVTKSVPNTSEQLGQLNDFLEQVSDNINEQQILRQAKLEEQPLSDTVFMRMKPIFPPLPFEVGTEADFVRGPHYHPQALPLEQSSDSGDSMWATPPAQNSTEFRPETADSGISVNPGTSAQASGNTSEPQPFAGPNGADDMLSDLSIDRMWKTNSSMWGNALPKNDVVAALTCMQEDPELSHVYDYHLNQVETQLAAEQTLEVTSGLRNLLNDVIGPEELQRQQHPHERHPHERQAHDQYPNEPVYQYMSMDQSHLHASSPPYFQQQHEQHHPHQQYHQHHQHHQHQPHQHPPSLALQQLLHQQQMQQQQQQQPQQQQYHYPRQWHAREAFNEVAYQQPYINLLYGDQRTDAHF